MTELVITVVATSFITSIVAGAVGMRIGRYRKGEKYEIEKISEQVAERKIEPLKKELLILQGNVRDDIKAYNYSTDRLIIDLQKTQSKDHDDITRLQTNQSHTDIAITEIKSELDLVAQNVQNIATNQAADKVTFKTILTKLDELRK